MYKDEYFFPIVIEGTEQSGYSLYFPDLPGCVSGGDTMEEVLHNAKEALSLHLYGMEGDGDEIPAPSNLRDIALDPGDSCALVEVNMRIYRKRRQNKSINRVITLPDWLNEEIKQSGANVSQLAQEACKSYLGLREKPQGRPYDETVATV
ncbi:MAG: type II toxin-antitoxin system HicB family antitoxin [Clostridiales bacterium]|jgi:predicted RNase H-like HicB family nuclease|nr:type II toxin-antitoxin system HicB family antitoxin [Clostridiales bacterium]